MNHCQKVKNSEKFETGTLDQLQIMVKQYQSTCWLGRRPRTANLINLEVSGDKGHPDMMSTIEYHCLGNNSEWWQPLTPTSRFYQHFLMCVPILQHLWPVIFCHGLRPLENSTFQIQNPVLL
jgi:hypothetical protein